MFEDSEDFFERSDLSLHLILNLPAHESELFEHFVRLEITANLDVLDAGLVDFAAPNQLTRRVGHKRSKTNEQDYSPRNLYAERKPPLSWSIGSVAAGKSDPVGQHCSEGYATAGNAANKTPMSRSRYFTEVDGHSCHHTPDILSQLDMYVCETRLKLTLQHILPKRGLRGTFQCSLTQFE